MGERSEIELYYSKNKEIYLYSHWTSIDELRQILASALIRGKDRWNDESYLARIIFSDMIEDDIKSLTGYGISPNSMGDYQIKVNLIDQTIEGLTFEEFIKKYNN